MLVDTATREKRIIEHRKRNAAIDAAANYIDEMGWEGLAVKYIRGDGADLSSFGAF